MMRLLIPGLLSALVAGTVLAYPLDDGERTGIRRLEVTRQAQLAKRSMPEGSLLNADQITIAGLPSADLGPIDAEFSAAIRAAITEQPENYAVAVLDMSDPERLRFGAHQPDLNANVGSVGKLLVVMAWMDQLAKRFPDDIAARERVLRQTQIVTDAYGAGGSHVVPITSADGRIHSRPLQTGDQANLWEYMDWMLSASSNGGASQVMKELAAFSLMGANYSNEQAPRNAALNALSNRERGKLMLDAMLAPLAPAGLDQKRIRQGSLFSNVGKSRMPGTSSYASPRTLLQLLALIESGRFVDPWSSLETKRLLYMTQRRIRYASHPVLNRSAVFFKSGSFYQCQPEAGFVCRKYMGNKLNRLASVAIIESPAGQPTLRYAVAVMSNVLRVNSAVAHQSLALRIHRLIEKMHAGTAPLGNEKLPAATLEDAEGRGGDR